MSSLMVKAASKVAKSQMESEMKNLAKPPPIPAGGTNQPRRRVRRDGMGDKLEGCCNKCCDKCCRFSPWTQVVCWIMIAFIISTAILWLGGAFLVGPAKNNPSHGFCGVSIDVPILNKDAYVFYLGTSGIVITIMIFSSCICCCTAFTLCSTGCPKPVRFCGIIGLIVTIVGISIYLGWMALGTYYVIKIRGADTICRNVIVYLILMYVYLFTLVLVGIVGAVWSCNSWIKSEGRWKTKNIRRGRVRKK